MRILLRYFSAGVCAALLATHLAASATAQTVTNSADPELKKKADQLTLENSVTDQQLHKDLAKLDGREAAARIGEWPRHGASPSQDGGGAS